MIIFLDFDGVLHPFAERRNKARQFECLPRLEAVLSDFPAVQIAITSAWRIDAPTRLLDAFSADIRARVIGVTPDLTNAVDEANPLGRRQREAMQFLKDRDLLDCPWVAIDDDPANWLEDAQVIWCHNCFDESAEAQLRQLLKSCGD